MEPNRLGDRHTDYTGTKIKRAQYKADLISNSMATEQPLTKNLNNKVVVSVFLISSILKYLFRLSTGLL